MIETKILVLDTGPLWELVLYSAADHFRSAYLLEQIQHLRSKDHYENLTAFIACFQRRITTPHVVAEISKRIRDTEKVGHAKFWELVYGEFEKMGMDEESLELLQMPQGLVAAMGAIDVSILEVASSYGPSQATVLSVDRKLISECKEAGVDAEHLSGLI